MTFQEHKRIFQQLGNGFKAPDRKSNLVVFRNIYSNIFFPLVTRKVTHAKIFKFLLHRNRGLLNEPPASSQLVLPTTSFEELGQVYQQKWHWRPGVLPQHNVFNTLEEPTAIMALTLTQKYKTYAYCVRTARQNASKSSATEGTSLISVFWFFFKFS